MLYLLPCVRLVIKVKPFANFFKHGRGCIRSKLKSISLIGPFVELLHRVVKAARGPHQGNSAVAHTIHLIKATRLVHRGHKKNIGARFDLMREGLARITLINANSVRRMIVPRLQKVFVFLRAGSERNKKRAGVENLGCGFAN